MAASTVEEVEATVRTLPGADVDIGMSQDVYIQEALTMGIWALPDKPTFEKTGFKWDEYVGEMPLRAAVARSSISHLAVDKSTPDEASVEWASRCPGLTAHVRELHKDMSYAFRHYPALKARVPGSPAGKSAPLIIQELSDAVELCRANMPLLLAINFDPATLDTTEALAAEMGSLLGAHLAAKMLDSPEKKFRNQAFAHLKEAVDELRDAGHHAFDGVNPERLQGYISKERQRQYLAQKKRDEEKKAAELKKAADEKAASEGSSQSYSN